jgi:hypothetical protein
MIKGRIPFYQRSLIVSIFKNFPWLWGQCNFPWICEILINIDYLPDSNRKNKSNEAPAATDEEKLRRFHSYWEQEKLWTQGKLTKEFDVTHQW